MGWSRVSHVKLNWTVRLRYKLSNPTETEKFRYKTENKEMTIHITRLGGKESFEKLKFKDNTTQALWRLQSYVKNVVKQKYKELQQQIESEYEVHDYVDVVWSRASGSMLVNIVNLGQKPYIGWVEAW